MHEATQNGWTFVGLRKRAWVVRFRRIGACAIGLLCIDVQAAPSGDALVSKEYQLKAAFLYNFTKFVDWPPQHFATEDEPITIAILGEDPFGEELKRIVANRTVNGREISIKIATTVADVQDAELVFFMRAQEDDRLKSAVEELHAAGVLTVGESSAFKQLGGMIVFVLEGDKVRFEIDMRSAERSGVKISAQLQKLAKAVRRNR